jgi:hypothetical protein
MVRTIRREGLLSVDSKDNNDTLLRLSGVMLDSPDDSCAFVPMCFCVFLNPSK